MHISIIDDLKKQFHAVCALRGLKMSQVVVDMIEQGLKANTIQLSNQFHPKNGCELEFGDSVSDPNGTLDSCETLMKNGCGGVGVSDRCRFFTRV